MAIINKCTQRSGFGNSATDIYLELLINEEEKRAKAAEQDLLGKIEGLQTANSAIVDIVETIHELNSYNTENLINDDIIVVAEDEDFNGNTSYYRFVNGNFEFILALDQYIKSCLQKVTYDELKDLRYNGNLIPGQQYRIIDYVTTTTQENTQSAGHQFDIIVTADDEKTLNENARAAIHEGDDYFQQLVAEQKVISAHWKNGVTLDSITEKYKLSDDNEQYLSPRDEDKEITDMLTITNKEGIEVPCLFNPYPDDPDDTSLADYLVYCGLYKEKKVINTLLTTYYTITEDESEMYTGSTNEGDVFVEIGYKDIDGVSTPVLYKEDIELYVDDNSSVDYEDEFRYLDDYELDGITYNRWAKYDSDSDGYFQILTNIIVVDNQFTISPEDFREAVKEITTVYDK